MTLKQIIETQMRSEVEVAEIAVALCRIRIEKSMRRVK